MKGYSRAKSVSTWRRIAFAFWDGPKDGTIYGHVTVDVTKSLEYIEKVERESGHRLSLGVLVGRALAVAYKKYPYLNGKIIWNRIYTKDTVDVFYQVDIDDGGDLAGVVVRSVEDKSPVEVAQALRAKAGKLRSGEDEQYEKTQKGLLGRLPSFILRFLLGVLNLVQYNLGLDLSFMGAEPDPFGTIMVTNVSRFGVDVAYAPLCPPTRVPMVVLVGAVKDRPMAIEGEVLVRPTMTISATFDHRFADGNQIGRIQNKVLDYLRDPEAYESEQASPTAKQEKGADKVA